MADISGFRFASDELSIRRQIGINETDAIPENVLPEYEKRITMLHRDNVSGSLGSSRVMEMLRHLNIGPIFRANDRPTTPIDWLSIEKGTPVIVKCPERGFMKGSLYRKGGGGTLSIDIPGQIPRVQQFPQKDILLDEGQFEHLAEVAASVEDQWKDAEPGTSVVFTDEKGIVYEGLLIELGPGPEKMKVLCDSMKANGGEVLVDRSRASKRELVGAL